MSLAISCARCGKIFTVGNEFSGQKIRCRACGQVQRVPFSPPKQLNVQATPYPLEPAAPALPDAQKSQADCHSREPLLSPPRPHLSTNWQQFLRAAAKEASVLEKEILGLIVLSAADVLVTYFLLRRGPAFYESNPIAHWFFARWNIAGMAVFKFSAMGVVIVIGEIVERHRPGRGRALLVISCLATAAVVWYGLRLVFGHADNGAPL
jgi:hypothetical protein